jgi:hypothetical protein
MPYAKWNYAEDLPMTSDKHLTLKIGWTEMSTNQKDVDCERRTLAQALVTDFSKVPLSLSDQDTFCATIKTILVAEGEPEGQFAPASGSGRGRGRGGRAGKSRRSRCESADKVREHVHRVFLKMLAHKAIPVLAPLSPDSHTRTELGGESFHSRCKTQTCLKSSSRR